MKPTTDEAILQVRGLTVRFGSLVAVDGVGFDAQRGHITAVIGPNGAGKSSLFNLISGAIRPSAGQVLLDGRDVTGASPDRMLAAGLSRSFQITNLFSNCRCARTCAWRLSSSKPGAACCATSRPAARRSSGSRS
jgi:ABC-type branched-subunit amino acid transport system ATPase component